MTKKQTKKAPSKKAPPKQEKERYSTIEEFFANEMALPHETYLWNCPARRKEQVKEAWELYIRE